MGLFPDLNFAAAADDTNTEVRQEVVGGIGMVVDTTIEDRSSVLANSRIDHSLPTGVVFDERADIVDNTSNKDEGTTVFGLFLIFLELHDRELLERDTPVENSALLVELLLLLLEPALFDLILTELLKIISETKLFPGPNTPFGRII